jgi:hypothetical protein
MPNPEVDKLSAGRRAQDEQIVAESLIAPLELQADVCWSSVETHLARFRRQLKNEADRTVNET